MSDINQIINDKLEMLLKSGIDSSRFEIKLLIGHILGVEPKDLSLTSELSTAQLRELDKMLDKRLRHCPVDKIIGSKGFYKYDFVVNEDVLSPRADTEVLVEKAIVILHQQKEPKILEFGVGSGCIILSVLADIKDAKGIGVDISEQALAVTDINAEKLDISDNRLVLMNMSWFDDNAEQVLSEYAPFDMILSNPPYIASDEIVGLDEEVKNYDPWVALDGGQDGLKDYVRILDLAQKLLKQGGCLLLEAGDGEQLERIANAGKLRSLEVVEKAKDLGGIERCIILKK